MDLNKFTEKSQAALAEGYAPSQHIADTPLRMQLAGGEVWEPHNFSGEFQGDVTLREALVESINVPTIRLAAAVGIPAVVRLARRAGVTSPLPELLGEGGLFIDPACPGALSNALETVLMDDNRREQMRRAGLAAARALTWENAARQLLNVMDRVSTNGDA